MGRDRFEVPLHDEATGVLTLQIKDLTSRDRQRIREVLCASVLDEVAFREVRFSRSEILGFSDDIDRVAREYESIAAYGPNPDENAIEVYLNRRDPAAVAALRRVVPKQALRFVVTEGMVACLAIDPDCGDEEEGIDTRLIVAAGLLLLGSIGLLIALLRKRSRSLSLADTQPLQ